MTGLSALRVRAVPGVLSWGNYRRLRFTAAWLSARIRVHEEGVSLGPHFRECAGAPRALVYFRESHGRQICLLTLLCQANRGAMKRPFRKQILAASMIAACVGCSRSGHLYSLTVVAGGHSEPTVPTATDHFWGSPANYIAQFRVPFDAQGRECHNPEKVTDWRTLSEVYTIYTPGHYSLCVPGAIWEVVIMLCVAVGMVVTVIGAAASHFRKLLHEKPDP